MTRHLSLLPLAAGLLGLAACSSPIAGYCQAAAECNKFDINFEVLDTVGDDDDSERVCEADQNGQLAALRANTEDKCHVEADDWEKFTACVADKFNADHGSACDLMTVGSDNPCHGELNNWLDSVNDAGDRCSENQQ
ncbi:MAG TPA: hypothetical protein VGO62_06555 [Myxococcota bacterium]|jgi:hypothetical protein